MKKIAIAMFAIALFVVPASRSDEPKPDNSIPTTCWPSTWCLYGLERMFLAGQAVNLQWMNIPALDQRMMK